MCVRVYSMILQVLYKVVVSVSCRLADEAKVSRAQAKPSESYSDSDDELTLEEKREL